MDLHFLIRVNPLVGIDNYAQFERVLVKRLFFRNNTEMGFWSTKLLDGTKNKCIDAYLGEIAQRFRSATEIAGFPKSPQTILNIHIAMAPQFFSELDVFLRIKGNYSPLEIDGHFLDSEAKALATVCAKLGLDFEEVEGLMSDSAYDLAESNYDKKISPQENFAKIKNGKELKGTSVMWRHTVLKAFEFIHHNN